MWKYYHMMGEEKHYALVLRLLHSYCSVKAIRLCCQVHACHSPTALLAIFSICQQPPPLIPKANPSIASYDCVHDQCSDYCGKTTLHDLLITNMGTIYNTTKAV
jgi:hypothetical protein